MPSAPSSERTSCKAETSELVPFVGVSLAIIDNTINGFLANPIQSGYLLKFSQSEFNAENLIYVLEIDRFKDLCSDSKAWNNDLSYKLIDMNIENFGSVEKTEKDLVLGGACTEGSWPSTKIPISSFIEHVKMIWDKFLSHSAATQICMHAAVFSNTVHRLEYLHLYGHKVFDETLIDPIKTLNADVCPRFLTSQHYKNMSRRLQELYPLPAKDKLQIRLPHRALCADWDDEKITVENLRAVNMYDLFHDRLLYGEFLKYSKRMYSEENVYLTRAISIFKHYFDHGAAIGEVPIEAEDQAWLLFRYFIAPGSVYEIGGLSQYRRKEIMLKMAHPEPEMFSQIERHLHRVVHDQYISFSSTYEFKSLPEKALEMKKTYQMELLNKSGKSSRDKDNNGLRESKERDPLDTGCLGFAYSQRDLTTSDSKPSRKGSIVRDTPFLAESKMSSPSNNSLSGSKNEFK